MGDRQAIENAPDWLVDRLATAPKTANLLEFTDAEPPQPTLPRERAIEIRSALTQIDPACSRQDWITVGMAIHDLSRGSREGLELWLDWSRSAAGRKTPNGNTAFQGDRHCCEQWDSFGQRAKSAENGYEPITILSLWNLAWRSNPNWTWPFDGGSTISPTHSEWIATPSAPSHLVDPLGKWSSPISELWLERLDWTQPPPPQHFLLRQPLPISTSATTPTLAAGEPFSPGFLELGECALIAADGGVGKTWLAIELALAVATKQRWLGHFPVDPDAPRGACLLLGESKPEGAWRRLRRVADQLALSAGEVDQAMSHTRVLSLHGHPLTLAREDRERGLIVPSGDMNELSSLLYSEPPDGGWGLIVIDTMARFAPNGVETDNGLATGFVQQMERLTQVPGNPSVLVTAHASKTAVDQGRANVRGVTGIRNGFRWAATLTKKADGLVQFVHDKGNEVHLAPELCLVRTACGSLRVETDAEANDRQAAVESKRVRKAAARDEQSAQRDAEVQTRILIVMAEFGMSIASKDAVAVKAGRQAHRCRPVVDALVADGLMTSKPYQITKVGIEAAAQTGQWSQPDGMSWSVDSGWIPINAADDPAA